MSEMLKGDPAAPLEIEAKLRKRLMLLGTPGLVDIALADTRKGHPLFLLFSKNGSRIGSCRQLVR
jgi:hypothetical protein